MAYLMFYFVFKMHGIMTLGNVFKIFYDIYENGNRYITYRGSLQMKRMVLIKFFDIYSFASVFLLMQLHI